MGRRGIRVEEEERWVFNRLADAYRARPPYPSSLIERLRELAGSAEKAADLGAGTGLVAIPLAARGLWVDAVEPAAAMLAVLSEEAARQGGARVHPVHAAAEATGLPAGRHGLVVLADAVQWVDPERTGGEAQRLLAPAGACAVVEIDFAPTPFMTALQALLQRFNPKARPATPGATTQLLRLATRGAPLQVESHLDEVQLSEDALTQVLRSFSFVGPALGPVRLEELLQQVRALFRAHGGARWTRQLTLTWGRSTSG